MRENRFLSSLPPLSLARGNDGSLFVLSPFYPPPPFPSDALVELKVAARRPFPPFLFKTNENESNSPFSLVLPRRARRPHPPLPTMKGHDGCPPPLLPLPIRRLSHLRHSGRSCLLPLLPSSSPFHRDFFFP